MISIKKIMSKMIRIINLTIAIATITIVTRETQIRLLVAKTLIHTIFNTQYIQKIVWVFCDHV